MLMGHAMRRDWTRNELVVVFNLYCKIPFAKTKATNPAVIEIARIIGRTPAAVAMKLGNFGSFDPALRAKGISGLSRASKTDQEIWSEFNGDWEGLAVESELATEQLVSSVRKHQTISQSVKQRIDRFLKGEQVTKGPSEIRREVKVRLQQRFFRDAVLASYRVACCVCSNPVRELLAAGHIIPWSIREDLRANPRNGLCLCSLHHDAFDAGFWCVDDSYKILLASQLCDYKPNRAIELNFFQYAGADLHLPDKFWPEQVFLARHRQSIFRGQTHASSNPLKYRGKL